MMVMILGSAAAVVGIFTIGLGTMLSNWFYVRKCEEEANQELGKVKTIAYQDPLTGVKSKHAYFEYEIDLEHKIDNGEAEDFAILVCDVNGLKHVNDTQGHKAGDAYICQASELICKLFSHSPVFRIGGDEFAVILTGSDYQSRAAILKTFNERVESNIASGDVIVSAGISEFEKGTDESIHAVFQRADQVMYERKKELKAMGARTR
jgi:diguanylate cyclase (GGDEF)-like protein